MGLANYFLIGSEASSTERNTKLILSTWTKTYGLDVIGPRAQFAIDMWPSCLLNSYFCTKSTTSHLGQRNFVRWETIECLVAGQKAKATFLIAVEKERDRDRERPRQRHKRVTRETETQREIREERDRNTHRDS